MAAKKYVFGIDARNKNVKWRKHSSKTLVKSDAWSQRPVTVLFVRKVLHGSPTITKDGVSVAKKNRIRR